MTNVFGYDSNNIFDQSLNTDDSVTFNKVTLTAPTANDTDAATKLYVDTHGGGGGGGNMTYTGTTPATNYIYKAYASDGHDAIKSSITDNGTTVSVNSGVLKCNTLDGIADSTDLNIGNTQVLVNILASDGLTANKVTVNAGTNQQYMMADGSLLEASAQNGNANFYLYNNINGLSLPPPSNGDVEYNATTLASTTIVYISHLTRDGVDIDVYLALINTLDDLYIQDQTNSANFAKFNITSAPTLIPNNYISIPVAQVQFGGTGNTAFGANHDILVSFFSNLQEINTRLTTLETKTQNQTAIPLITTFDNTVTVPIIKAQAIGSLSGNPLDSVTIGLGDYSVKLDATNGVKAYSYALYSGTASQFLKGDGVPDTNVYALASSVSSGQGMPVNSLFTNTISLPTGSRAYWFTAIAPYATTINGFNIYVDSGGADFCHFAIYRSYLKSGVGTNPGLNITLCGQSATGVVLSNGMPFNRIPVVAVAGQNLNFSAGEYLTIAFHTNGSSNVFLGTPVGSLVVKLFYTTIANYSNSSFPATLANTSISAGFTQRPCFDLY